MKELLKLLLTLLIATLLFSCENIDDIVNREQQEQPKEQPKEQQEKPKAQQEQPKQPAPTPTPAPKPATEPAPTRTTKQPSAPTPAPTRTTKQLSAPTPAPPLAPTIPCKAGSYDPDNDWVVDYILECYPNGKLKKRTIYRKPSDEYILFHSRHKEYTYWESTGNRKVVIAFSDDGVTKYREYTYWENGNQKEKIYYYDGVTKSSYYTYYENGTPKLFIDYARHPLDLTIPPYKSRETTFWESNGKEKTHTLYMCCGTTRGLEATYWQNGNKKTQINFQSDGSVNDFTCYDSTGASEPCTQSRHGCTSSSTTCIN